MERLVANWYIYIYDNMYSFYGVYDELTKYSDAISGCFEEGGILHSAYVLMTSLGLGMLSVYFVIAAGTRLSGKNASTAQFFKTLVEFFIGYALALNSFDIVKYMFYLGDSMAAELAGSSSIVPSLEPYATPLVECLEDFELFDLVMYALKALIPYLACLISSFFVAYVVVSRVLRICVNAVMSPIAVANFFEGTRRSDSIRFLKRTAAMGLQCSVIMIIMIAVTDLAGYMAGNPQYSEAMSASNTVQDYADEMLESSQSNYAELKTDVEYAVDKLGMSARNGIMLKSEYREARNHLLDDYDSVTPADEAKFKEYENMLDVEIFSRNGTSYVYDSNNHAILKDKYLTLDYDSTIAFLNAMLGNNNYIVLIMLLAVKAGMIKQSISLCNTIVGV